MSTKKSIDWLTIKGFKSIRSLNRFPLNQLNVLIGGNGVGKSNLVSYFKMLSEMVGLRLQNWTTNQGSADRIVTFGVKQTQKIHSFIKFGLNGYKFELQPTIDGGFSFLNESLYFDGPYFGEKWIPLGSGHKEAKLQEEYRSARKESEAVYCYSSISSWKVFHFHDTSDSAGVKRLGSLQDNEYLRTDASNLAAYLYRLHEEYPDILDQIVKTVRLALPFFDNFVLRPRKLKSDEEQISLLWRQKDTDYSLWPSQLSDGSIRFICLATALLQPDPPSTIIIDEPELGLHPYAITLLGSLVRSASKRMQVIISTQSVPLVNQFDINDLVIVENENDGSIFKRCDENELNIWLEEYSVGELWEKNILGGRPSK